MTSFLQRGYAAVKARNPAEAAQWFEKALGENPEDSQAKAWLGQCLCSMGRRDEGAKYLRQAGQDLLKIARESGNISQVLEVTAQLQHWSDFSGALELGSQAVQINSSEFRGFQLLAVTYSQLNNKTEAIKAGRQALELAPENTMMQILLGSLEADAGQNESAKSRLEKALVCPLNAREEFRAHKELARVLDKLGEYDQVFAHLHAAAKLTGSLPEYSTQDAALIPNMLKANKAGFKRELMARWSGTEFPQDQPAPTFLIGFFRSGTTLTQEVLAAHPDVFVADEADLVWAMQRELQQMNRSNASMVEKLKQLDLAGVMHLREFYWSRAKQRYGDAIGQRVFVDKFTLNTIDLGLINCIFPDAKVIFVMRDPRDVCLSCFMQLMVPTPATVHLQSWLETADFYAQVMDWWAYIKQQMTLGFIEFRYEDAVAQFEPTYRKVFDFLGLPWDPAVVDFHKSAAEKFIASPSRSQVAQPLYSSSVARWRHYESEFAPVSELLSPIVSAYNYDPF
jgi:tetratricopeptide (TPR) repeat protein